MSNTKSVLYSEPMQKRNKIDLCPLKQVKTPQIIIRRFSNNTEIEPIKNTDSLDAIYHINAESQAAFKIIYNSIVIPSFSQSTLTERSPNILIKSSLGSDELHHQKLIGSAAIKKKGNRYSKLQDLTKHYQQLKAHISNSIMSIGLPPIKYLASAEKENAPAFRIISDDINARVTSKALANGRGQYHPRVLNPYKKTSNQMKNSNKCSKFTLKRLVM